MRIGQGFDAHRFSDDPARALTLGLVEIPGASGLDGHSDADVATHALCDALLGAAHRGDIGVHFPSDDEQWRGVASSVLLARVMEILAADSWGVVNADLTIVCQRPRLRPHIEDMERALSSAIDAPVSVKATTTDRMGSVGEGVGIAVMAVCLLEER